MTLLCEFLVDPDAQSWQMGRDDVAFQLAKSNGCSSQLKEEKFVHVLKAERHLSAVGRVSGGD